MRNRPLYTKKYKVFWTIYFGVLTVFLLSKIPLLLGEADEARAQRIDGLVLLIFAVLGTILLCVFVLRPYRRWEADGKEKVFRLRPWHLLLLAANNLYAFWVLEYVNNEQMLEITPFYILINQIGIFVMSLLLLLWLNSLRRALLAVLCIWSSVAIAFYLVYTLRGEPLQIIDFTILRTAFSVSGQYSWPFARAFVPDIVLGCCLMAIYLHLPLIVLAKKKPGKLMLRVAAVAAMIGGYFFYFYTPWNSTLHIKTDLFAPIKTYKQYGTSIGFFSVGKYMRLTPPEGYSSAKVRAIAEEAEARDAWNRQSPIQPVNIIAIMNEAWADFSYAGNLQTNYDPMPYYHGLQENTIKGQTLVCITGGGTAKSEYEFLTGNSVKRFPGMVPYVSYFTKEQYSLVTTLQAQGYTSLAMHPYKGSNWNRPSAYALMHFDDFLTEEDFDENVEMIGNHISDRANYEKIVALVNGKEHPEDKLFLFNITMQNHGGYVGWDYTGDIQVENYTAEEADREVVNRYLSLCKESDNALMYLIETFRDMEEPTLIVMFGDHYPTMPDSFIQYLSGSTLEELDFADKQRYYATPFFVWANYDIPEQEGILTSTNYLGTMLLEQTGLEVAPFNRYLAALQQDMPALNHQGYVNAEGESIPWSEAAEKVEQEEWAYECLQYNALAGKRDRLDWFFTIGGDE